MEEIRKHYKLRASEAKPKIANLIKDDDYYTPKELVDMFGKFDYDPATTKEQAEYLGIENYDTIETNGLDADWTLYNKIWINPPFTQKFDFLKKAVETYKKTKADIYVLLPVEALTTKKFEKAIDGMIGIMYIPNGRIKFTSGKGRKTTSPAFGSIIIKIGDEHKFKEVKL